MVINLLCAKLWLMAAGLMRLQVSKWDDCKDWVLLFDVRPGVSRWENPRQQNPSPSVPPTMPTKQRQKCTTFSHTNIPTLTEAGFTQLLNVQSCVLCSMLYLKKAVLDADWSVKLSSHLQDGMMHNSALSYPAHTVIIQSLISYYFILKLIFWV